MSNWASGQRVDLGKTEADFEKSIWVYENGEPIFELSFWSKNENKTHCKVTPMHLDGRAQDDSVETECDWGINK